MQWGMLHGKDARGMGGYGHSKSTPAKTHRHTATEAHQTDKSPAKGTQQSDDKQTHNRDGTVEKDLCWGGQRALHWRRDAQDNNAAILD